MSACVQRRLLLLLRLRDNKLRALQGVLVFKGVGQLARLIRVLILVVVRTDAVILLNGLPMDLLNQQLIVPVPLILLLHGVSEDVRAVIEDPLKGVHI